MKIPAFLEAFVETIFPPVCPICSCCRPGAGLGCAACLHALALLRARPACPTCAASPGPFLSADGRCGQCRGRRPRLDGAVRVAPYVPPMRPLLQRFKFGPAYHVDSFLSDLMHRALREAPWFSCCEALVPVPSHWSRTIGDRQWAAGTMALQVARRCGRPSVPLLRRVRLDPHQFRVAYSARSENVRGAFALKSGASVSGARLCVVDDVMTSGATANEVARVLKQAGAARVWILILARAGRQEAALQIA